MKFLPEGQEMPWGHVDYLLADLGFVDSVAVEGWLKGNTLSDIMQTYLERVVGETAFDWYGTQFPVLVKKLDIKGRTSLHITPDDETAEQRYDAFGKTALWYVTEVGPEARLYLGFKRPVGAEEFFRACADGSVEDLLYSVKPRVGESYLITPGLVHAAKDVTLLEIAESSELWFRLHDWGSTDREMHLEEAFDLINFDQYHRTAAPSRELLAAEDQFTVGQIHLKSPLESHAGIEETFLIYICVGGEATLKTKEDKFTIKAGELILVPAELSEFTLAPVGDTAVVLEVRMDPRASDDIVSEPVEE
jgi:mannose-6-phosphate isomerase